MNASGLVELCHSGSSKIRWPEDVRVHKAQGLLGLGEILDSGESISAVVLHHGVVEAETVVSMTQLPVYVCAEHLTPAEIVSLFRAGVADVCSIEELPARCAKELPQAESPIDALLSDEGSWLLHADLIEREKLATLGELATGMAHSINNPAAWVVTNLNELQLSVQELHALLESSLEVAEKHGPQDRVEELRVQAKSAYYPQNFQDMKDMLSESLEGMRRIRDIVGDLKGFQRADEDEWMPLDVSKALNTAVEMARSQGTGAVDVVLEYTETSPVNASPGRLAQAFLNLIMNGIQAYDSTAPQQAVVRIVCESDAGSVRVLFEDFGRGISPEQQSRIFDPFYTLQESKGHSGLGLAICRDIVHRHGGDIQVDSVLGEGTRVEVRLPIPAEFQKRAEEDSLELEMNSLPRILLVDDEPALTRAIRRVLKGLAEITVAHTADEAAEQIHSNPPNLVLCDLTLPDRSGMDLYAEVCQSNEAMADLFLFLTGGAKTPKAENFLKEHADRVVFKPFESPELRERVKSALN